MSAGILLCRILVGLGEGVAPTSATDMVASVLDKKERSRSIGFIFSGLHVGSLAGLLVAPVLIERFGWPAVSHTVIDQHCNGMVYYIAMFFDYIRASNSLRLIWVSGPLRVIRNRGSLKPLSWSPLPVETCAIQARTSRSMERRTLKS